MPLLEKKEYWEIVFSLKPILDVENEELKDALEDSFRENRSKIERRIDSDYKGKVYGTSEFVALLFLRELDNFSEKDINSIFNFEIETNIIF